MRLKILEIPVNHMILTVSLSTNQAVHLKSNFSIICSRYVVFRFSDHDIKNHIKENKASSEDDDNGILLFTSFLSY